MTTAWDKYEKIIIEAGKIYVEREDFYNTVLKSLIEAYIELKTDTLNGHKEKPNHRILF